MNDVPVEVPEEREYVPSRAALMLAARRSIENAVGGQLAHWPDNPDRYFGLAAETVLHTVEPLITARVRAEERRRITAELEIAAAKAIRQAGDDCADIVWIIGLREGFIRASAALAAGSAVPVATSEPAKLCQHGEREHHWMAAGRYCPGPVTTPDSAKPDRAPSGAGPGSLPSATASGGPQGTADSVPVATPTELATCEHGRDFPYRFCSGPISPAVPATEVLPIESCAPCWPLSGGWPGVAELLSAIFADECHEEVTRRGQLQPCDKPAVALRLDPHEHTPYPVCTRHCRAPMVALRDLMEWVRRG